MKLLLLVIASCGVVFGVPGHGKQSNEELDKLFSSQECMSTNNLPIPKSFFNPTAADIEFRLYTRTSQYKYDRLINNDKPSVDRSTLNASLPMLVVSHGFQGSADTCMWMHHIKNKWLEKESMNVILVDWNALADKNIFCYPQAAKNALFVGKELANLLNFLKTYTGLSPTATHIIGFSLGAHVAGAAGYGLQQLTRTNLARITGLDPAGPKFHDAELNDRLDDSDADFVDIIHTDAGLIYGGHFHLGYKDPLGHVDFYMNGGNFQKGCPTITNPFGSNGSKATGGLFSCNHGRAHEYYIESLDADEPSYGYMCENYDTFQSGGCLNYINNSVGYAVTPDMAGLFYSDTQAEPTFLTRSILISLTVGETEDESSYYGQVYVHVNLPTGRKEGILEMTSGWTKIEPGTILTKLLTIPSGTALDSIQISVLFWQNPLHPQLYPNHLIAKPIEAYDAFEKKRYCLSGCIDLPNYDTKAFTPENGSCPVIDCGHSSSEVGTFNKLLLVLNLSWVLYISYFI